MSLLPGFLRVGFLSPSHLNISLQDQFSSAPESASSCLSLRGDALFFSRDLIFPNSVVPFQPGFIKKRERKKGKRTRPTRRKKKENKTDSQCSGQECSAVLTRAQRAARSPALSRPSNLHQPTLPRGDYGAEGSIGPAAGHSLAW